VGWSDDGMEMEKEMTNGEDDVRRRKKEKGGEHSGLSFVQSVPSRELAVQSYHSYPN
jgi:hypothetical protein